MIESGAINGHALPFSAMNGFTWQKEAAMKSSLPTREEETPDAGEEAISEYWAWRRRHQKMGGRVQLVPRQRRGAPDQD